MGVRRVENPERDNAAADVLLSGSRFEAHSRKGHAAAVLVYTLGSQSAMACTIEVMVLFRRRQYHVNTEEGRCGDAEAHNRVLRARERCERAMQQHGCDRLCRGTIG